MGRRKTGVSRFNAQNTTAEDGEDVWAASVPQYSKPKLAVSTENSRARIFSDWNNFMSLMHPTVNCVQVWELIIRNDHESKLLVLKFIDRYIKLSGCPTRIWDTTILQRQRPVICVLLANGVMKQLIAAAEAEIVRLQRLKDPDKAWMQLARPQGTDGACDIGPVRDITRIATILKDKWGLTIDSGYSKMGAMPEDVQRLLRILWVAADHIPMPPINRIMMHLWLILLYHAGPRPGMLTDIRWRDIILWVKLDESWPGGRRPGSSVTLHRNKRKRDALLVGSDEDRFEFDLMMMATLLLCFTHLLIALAMKVGALKIRFKSVEDVIRQPILDSSGCATLEWNEEMLDKRVLILSYATFHSYWVRLCIVAGFETVPRPYSFRVGAGASINKHTTSSTRCYIMGHTNKTFQRDYQSWNIRVDLQKIHFGDLAGVTDTLPLSGISPHYDLFAPIYITQDHIREIETGKCIQELRRDIDALKARGADASKIQEAEGTLKYWRSRLQELKLLERRREYFRQAAQLRQERDEAGLRSLQEDPYQHYNGPGLHLTLDIERLMYLWAPRTVFDSEAEARALEAIQWLIYYMEGSFALISRASRGADPLPAASACEQGDEQSCQDTQPAASRGSGGSEQIASDEKSNPHQAMASTQGRCQEPIYASGVTADKGTTKPTCFICRQSFVRRSELTRHARVHRATLSVPFQCPECKRHGLTPPTTQTPAQWSNHVERVHGKQHAPNFLEHLAVSTSKANIFDEVTCAICNSRVSIHSFARHINTKHIDGSLNDQCKIVTCLSCPSMDDLSIDTYASHISTQHGVQPLERCPFCRNFLTRKGLVIHIRAYFRRSSSPLPCPLCEQQGQEAACFEDYPSWRIHAIQTPGHLLEDSALAPVYSPDVVLCYDPSNMQVTKQAPLTRDQVSRPNVGHQPGLHNQEGII